MLIKPIVFLPSLCRPRRWILKSLLGNLSNNDGDDYEKITYKVNWRCLKLSRVARLVRQMLGIFFGVEAPYWPIIFSPIPSPRSLCES